MKKTVSFLGIFLLALLLKRLIFGILQRADKRLALFFVAKGDVFQKTFGSHCPHLLKSG